MTFKLITVVMFIAGVKLFFGSFFKSEPVKADQIDQEWWDRLSEEWKSIFIISQNFQNQKVDIFKIQDEFVNRLNQPPNRPYSELNTSLLSLKLKRTFELSYTDFYKRALRTHHLSRTDPIDLSTLADLEIIYMVGGPADLAPLKKLSHLKILIANYCGVDNNIPVSHQNLDLEPLQYLKELRILHCIASPITSLKPLKNLANLEELHCEISTSSTIAPIGNLLKLKRLSIELNGTKAASISNLTNLEELFLNGCKKVPNLSKLKHLRKLLISEDEMAIVSSSYRIDDIEFLKNLPELEFLDFNSTSYKGSLEVLEDLKNLKAVTLPPVGNSFTSGFSKANSGCIIVNKSQYY